MTTKRGHSLRGAQQTAAAVNPHDGGQGERDTQPPRAPVEDYARLHALLGHYARLLWDVQKVRIGMGNRVGAMERDGVDASGIGPAQGYADELEKTEHSIDSQLRRLAKRHFMADWIDAQPGIGLPGFARILGATGPFTPVVYDEEGKVIAGFPNVAKLWAYLGQHVTDGHAPKRKKGEKANWSSQGRVVCHQIGESIVKVGHGQWRETYDAKKAFYLAKPRLGESGCPMGQVHKAADGGKVLACVKVDADGHETSAHLHNAAMRYAVKELLKAMWVEWTRRAIDALDAPGVRARLVHD